MTIGQRGVHPKHLNLLTIFENFAVGFLDSHGHLRHYASRAWDTRGGVRLSPIRNYASVAMCLAVIMLTDWSLWVSVPVGLLAGGLLAQVIGQYFPEPEPQPRRRRRRTARLP